MKKLAISLLSLFICLLSIGQGAGNWMYQSKSKANYDESIDFSRHSAPQQNQTYHYPTYTNDSVMVLNVNALMNVKANSFILVLGLSQISPKLEDAFQMIDERIESFINNTKVDKDDYYIDFVSQTPIFGRTKEIKLFSKKMVEVPMGFELKKNIHVKFENIDQADDFIKLAAQNEIYDIIRVDHIVNDHKAIYDTLRNECIKLLETYISDYEKLGISFDAAFKTIEQKNFCTFPISRYSSFTSYMPADYQPLSEGSNEVSYVNPNSNINIFYNKLPYNSYDIIINPDIVEPVVQFSQSVSMKIVLERK
jgi:hypothetical protein